MNDQETEQKIKSIIVRLEEIYQEKRDNFFNEYDFHHVFFNLAYQEFNNLVHPEYPSYKGFRRKKTLEDYKEEDVAMPLEEKEIYSYKKKGGKAYTRGWYDFIVLKQDFYNENRDNFDVVSNKKKPKIKQYLSCALEFKFFNKGINKPGRMGIKFDLFKLKNAIETEHKILIIFCRNLSQNDTDFIKNINDPNIVIYKYNENGEIK